MQENIAGVRNIRALGLHRCRVVKAWIVSSHPGHAGQIDGPVGGDLVGGPRKQLHRTFRAHRLGFGQAMVPLTFVVPSLHPFVHDRV